MVFSSAIFLFAFLPVLLVAYYLTPSRWRNYVALLASYIFYGWGEPVFALILFGSSLLDYFLSRCMHHAARDPQRKLLLTLSLVTNFSLLGYFKYANFVVYDLLGALPGTASMTSSWSLVALPIGISFFTFQKASYIIDVYRRRVNAAGSFADFALYVALFPQLIAGPIVRYHDINAQLKERSCTSDKFLQGMYRFSMGLGKKVLIANQLAFVADLLLEQPVGSLPMHYAWIAILAYTFQIYFDFSGYSDMAIGLGKMLGFTFLENFNRPYTSRSITEFWRRWHISLSNWMVEYLYVPLGGNRHKPWRISLNLWIVFLVSGLWHGASWSFILWGAYHGFFLSLERAIGKERLARIPALVACPTTFLVVVFGWVFFRIESINDALSFFGRLFDFSSWGQLCRDVPVFAWYDNRLLLVFVIAVLLSFNPIGRMPAKREIIPTAAAPRTVELLASVIVLFLCFTSLANSSYNPFIYFRF